MSSAKRNIFVDERTRGKGIGRSLAELAIEKGGELGCRFALVETLSFQAVGFYTRGSFGKVMIRMSHSITFENILLWRRSKEAC